MVNKDYYFCEIKEEIMLLVDKDCTRCKKCERICPTNSLTIDSENINEKYCIECYHCYAVCPNKDNKDEHVIGSVFQHGIQPYDFEQLMQQRRSNRDFSSKPISNELLSEFISNMRFSPTASNAQKLEFTIVINKGKLQLINDVTISTLGNTFKKSISPVTKPLIRTFFGKKTYLGLEKLKNKFMRKAAYDPNMICYNAPALILVHSEITPGTMPLHDANIWVGMATLYAEALNLATCINGYITNAVQRNKKLKKEMHIPANHQLHTTLLIGHAKKKFNNRVDRKLPKINFI